MWTRNGARCHHQGIVSSRIRASIRLTSSRSADPVRSTALDGDRVQHEERIQQRPTGNQELILGGRGDGVPALLESAEGAVEEGQEALFVIPASATGLELVGQRTLVGGIIGAASVVQ